MHGQEVINECVLCTDISGSLSTFNQSSFLTIWWSNEDVLPRNCFNLFENHWIGNPVLQLSLYECIRPELRPSTIVTGQVSVAACVKYLMHVRSCPKELNLNPWHNSFRVSTLLTRIFNKFIRTFLGTWRSNL